MKTILIQSDVKELEDFRHIIKTYLTDFKVVTSLENAALSDIVVVIIWHKVPTFLSKLPNLKLLLSCGSGVDHFINSSHIPQHIPLIRLVDPYLRNRVSNYVLQQILEKSFPNFFHEDKIEVHPEIYETIQRTNLRVGIMGLGLIGSSIAEKLLNYGFEVSGWVKTKKDRIITDVYIGDRELEGFAQKSNILVCQLPLTKETNGILNIKLFNHLPDGAFLINVGRGEHLIESDLLLGLEKGKLSGACLDVFEVEPLPSNHPFWTTPNVKITPHIAGYIGSDTQAPYASQVIKRYFGNGNLEGIVNYKAKY